MKRRKPWWLLVLLPIAAYLVWYLEPSKPFQVVEEIQDASDRGDMDDVLLHFDRAIQTEMDGGWRRATPKLLEKKPLWSGWRRAGESGDPVLREQFIDWQDPVHRYVVFSSKGGLPAMLYFRLRWTGADWRVDGIWSHSCLVSEELSRMWERWIRIG